VAFAGELISTMTVTTNSIGLVYGSVVSYADAHKPVCLVIVHHR